MSDEEPRITFMSTISRGDHPYLKIHVPKEVVEEHRLKAGLRVKVMMVVIRDAEPGRETT